jgi:C-terminal processing protease CtpA/Prc
VEKDTSGKARVGEAFPASAAARAGFQKGDELVAISGRLTQGMSQGALQLLVDGYAGVAQRVQIVRNGQQMELTLIPETPFQQRASVTIQLHTSRRLGFDAILVNHSNEQYLLVTRIEEEHLKQAGLRVGDLIVSINDRSERSVEELRGLVERKVPLRLRVRALGESTERVVQLFP